MHSQKVNAALDHCIGGAIRVLVPAVRGADFNAGKHSLDLVDLLEQLGTGKSAAVESFRADCDGIDLSFVRGNTSLERCNVGVEASIYIGPMKTLSDGAMQLGFVASVTQQVTQ